jgi:hypothetical protein
VVCVCGRRQSSAAGHRAGRQAGAHASAHTAQHGTAQHGTAQHGTAQPPAARDSAARHSAAQDSAAPCSTGQRSTGQRSPPQYGTAQHRTAQPPAARDSAARRGRRRTQRAGRVEGREVALGGVALDLALADVVHNSRLLRALKRAQPPAGGVGGGEEGGYVCVFKAGRQAECNCWTEQRIAYGCFCAGDLEGERVCACALLEGRKGRGKGREGQEVAQGRRASPPPAGSGSGSRQRTCIDGEPSSGPPHSRAPVWGLRISAAKEPQGRLRTPM